jgi:LmbE family N-acetylglucosaminyl deacetylase
MLLVISPHLDDAVLGCGQLLAAHPGSIVVTVFTGLPPEPERLTEWDAGCGFASAREAMQARRNEDRAALALLRGTPVWLDFCDAQYDRTPPVSAVRNALIEQLTRHPPDRVLYPLGLFHSDHFLVHEASREALAALPGLPAVAYEDALYRSRRGLLQQRLMALAAEGLVATPARLDGERGSAGLKLDAVKAYRSQLQGLGRGGVDDATQPERFWTLNREEAGGDGA